MDDLGSLGRRTEAWFAFLVERCCLASCADLRAVLQHVSCFAAHGTTSFVCASGVIGNIPVCSAGDLSSILGSRNVNFFSENTTHHHFKNQRITVTKIFVIRKF